VSEGGLYELLRRYWPELDEKSARKVVQFQEILAKENKIQNLTRLISPSDFVFGHTVDVRELLKTNYLTFPAMDLGSGCGVPGLLAALITQKPWILAEAEGHKADFLKRAVLECELEGQVRVFSGRAEMFLKTEQVETIVARAVGPVERIFGWIRNCSTWNKLVLLKGPSWTEEWQNFLSGRDKKKLILRNSHEYFVGPEKKKRIIVELERVPRGT